MPNPQPVRHAAARRARPRDAAPDRAGLRRQGVHGRGLRLAEVDLQDARLAAGDQDAEEADHRELRDRRARAAARRRRSPRCAGPGACPSRRRTAALKLARAPSSNRAMRLRLPSIPSRADAAPHHAALEARRPARSSSACCVVALTMVSLASLAKVSDGGRRNFAQVTQPLAALGSARALVSENAALADRHILEDTLETKRPLEQRILANDRRIARALAARRAHLHHRAGAQERALPEAQPRHLPQRHERALRRLARQHARAGLRVVLAAPGPRRRHAQRRPRAPLRRQGRRGQRAGPRGTTPSTARAGSCSRCSRSSSSSPSRPACSPSAASA